MTLDFCPYHACHEILIIHEQQNNNFHRNLMLLNFYSYENQTKKINNAMSNVKLNASKKFNEAKENIKERIEVFCNESKLSAER